MPKKKIENLEVETPTEVKVEVKNDSEFFANYNYPSTVDFQVRELNGWYVVIKNAQLIGRYKTAGEAQRVAKAFNISAKSTSGKSVL